MYQTNLLYFVQKWGENSETYKKAKELLDVLSHPGKEKIKHVYVKPDMFGYQVEAYNTTWLNYRTFIEAVVSREKNGTTVMIAHYRPLVAYLIREGVHRDTFDPRYVPAAGSNFKRTFQKLYQTINPEYHTFKASLERLQQDLNSLVDTLEKSVFNDIIFQVLQTKLHEEPTKHFDLDHCESLSNMSPDIRLQEQIINSCLGADIKREIKRKFTSVSKISSDASDASVLGKIAKLE